MNILFTCAGRRNYLINYFKEALKGQGRILAADMQHSAPAMVDADEAFIVPAIYAPNYIDAIKEIVVAQKVNAVISLNDLELPLLSKHKDAIEVMGTKVLVSGHEAIDISFDKWKTAQFVERLGLRSPKTFIELDKALQAIDSGVLQFPVVLKPRWGSASIGIDFPENIEELKLAYKLQRLRIERTILKEASSTDIDRSILIQEKISGKEFGMDVLNDFDGNYTATFVREKLAMRSGETDKAISVIDTRFEAIGKAIGQNLKHIGNLDCDVLEKDDKLYVLELNPRFGGGYPFSHEAGINTPAIYISWLKGNKDIQNYNNYQADIMFSKCDRLLKVN